MARKKRVWLTAKQKRFIDEYLLDLNATQAAIRAGYSEKTAKEIGYENLTKPHILAAIQDRMKEMEDAKVASIKEILEFLTDIMRGNVQEEIPILCGDGCQELIKKQVSTKERLKAAELLGKRYGLFTDKLSIENPVPVVIVDDLEEDDLEDGFEVET